MRWTSAQYKAHLARRKPKLRKPDGQWKTEQRFEAEILRPLLAAGEILGWIPQPFSLKLGPRCFYKPDFLVWLPEGRTLIAEVKGGRIWEDSMVKFKWACEKFPGFRWEMWQWKGREWRKILEAR